MLVKGWMTSDVMTIDEDTSMMKASQIMKENNIRRLPVMHKGKLVGMVTDRDIKEASPSKATTLDVHELYYLLSELKVKDIMSKNVFTIGPEETVEKAAVKMLEHRISGLPVVNDKGKVVGMITQGDIFKVLVSLTGIYRGGIQFAFNLEDRPGSIKEVGDLIRKHGGRMVSILTSYDMCDEGCRHVYIRIKEIPEDKLKALTEDLDKNFILLYMVKDSLKDV
ncbi:MAG: CBS domain-containing protein [Desulfobacteraceae bacterium]|jgi:acetoin utilization protein AcuB|nr:MAG: CBS domain-containing protein [Desulfobacteraceae bacterium]